MPDPNDKPGSSKKNYDTFIRRDQERAEKGPQGNSKPADKEKPNDTSRRDGKKSKDIIQKNE